MQDNRNPLILPSVPVQKRGCPKCGKEEYTGRVSHGMVTMTCHACRNQWHGGIGQIAQDPTMPTPPMDPNDRPTVDFVKNAQGKTEELRRRVSPVPEFRKGLPIPEGDE